MPSSSFTRGSPGTRAYRRRGVNRQMSDLRPFSEENGWEVGGEYVENDVNAHSGEERPPLMTG